ncbi:hypothetical protein HQ545_03535 [Candidatus Woesearchaeota archaeon]|nr:hypothetical protein [Candidatus Woesearchaeota archaeon]
METIKDPKDKVFKMATKSALIGRLPRKEGDKYKTAVIRLYDVNNPHKTTEFPKQTIEFTNTEKVRIRRLNVSYYLEGNDTVLNDLEEIYITHENNKLSIRGYQIEVETRQD